MTKTKTKVNGAGAGAGAGAGDEFVGVDGADPADASAVTVHLRLPRVLVDRIERVMRELPSVTHVRVTRTAVVESILSGTSTLKEFERMVEVDT